VDVVRHQHVSVDSTTVTDTGRRELLVEEAVVIVAVEDRLAVIAPLNDMC
jgi:hypothetical protein